MQFIHISHISSEVDEAGYVLAACVADVAFVIDNSGSIRDSDRPGGNNWRLILDFVKSITQVFTVGQDYTRVAVIDFGMMKLKV